MTMTETAHVATEPNPHGYRDFAVGSFKFSRDEYFATIEWPTGNHQMSVDAFLRSVQRDVAWGFFYGVVNFDSVFGTMNHYGNVDMFAGRFNVTATGPPDAQNSHSQHRSTPGLFNKRGLTGFIALRRGGD